MAYINGKEVLFAPINHKLTKKIITENGEYNASADNVDGYSRVIVNVLNATDPDTPLVLIPIMVYTEEEMTTLLETAPVGAIYQYMGTSATYEQGALYVVEEI